MQRPTSVLSAFSFLKIDMIRFLINGREIKTDMNPETPLVWFVREALGLTGTKWGCGKGLCGCCTVIVNGNAQRSCQLSLKDVKSARITTIEGIPSSHPVKVAWLLENVPECGYCQPGQIMNAIALLNKKPIPSEAEINDAMDSNLCRCGTYNRIKRAILRAARKPK